MVSTRTFVERSHPTSSGRLLEGKKKNGEPEKWSRSHLEKWSFTRGSNSGVSLGKLWSFGQEVFYDRWSLSRCGRTWRFDCMNSSWLKNTLSKKVLIKDIICTIGSRAAEPKGGGRLFGVEKRCEVIDQKRVRVLDRGIQTPRNRWKHEAVGRVLL